MPRCMMLKKKNQRGLTFLYPPRRSPPEATVAPPHNSPTESPTSTAWASMPRCMMVKKKSYRGLTLVDLPPRSPPEATVAPPRNSPIEGPSSTARADMPRCMMVKKSYHGSTLVYPPRRSPPEATVAPPRNSPTEGSSSREPTGCAERECAPVPKRSAEDIEAAHMLLSVARGVPRPPPVVTVQQPPVRPVQTVPTNTIANPARVYYIAEDTPERVYTGEPSVAPLPQFVNTVEPQVAYFSYRPIPEPQIQIVETVTISMTTSMPLSMPLTMDRIETLAGSSPPPPPPPLPRPPAVFISQCDPRHLLNRYDCNECGKRYSSLSNLCRHKQTHRSLDSDDAKRCQYCGKVYVSKPALAMHLLTHRMGYVCNVCGKQFSRLWLLSGHQRSHTGERPYHCAFLGCGKAFSDRSNLRAHVQTHSTFKNFQCPRCHRAFTVKNYLTKHKKISCPYCVNQRGAEHGEQCNE